MKTERHDNMSIQKHADNVTISSLKLREKLIKKVSQKP